MFKSVFARYISAFMVIFLVSFTLLGLVLGIMVSDYAMDEKNASAMNAAENIKEMINKDYYAFLTKQGTQEGGKTDPAAYLEKEREALATSLSAVSDYSNFQIFIVDNEGIVRITDNNSEGLRGRIPEEIRKR